MQAQTKTRDAFFIAGISVRTTNETGQSQQDIGALWEQFFRDNVLDQIPGKASAAIYCVYTDYESDASGAYTTLIGCEVSSIKNLPETLVGITIPAATYHVYTATGKLPQSVLQTWKYIWANEPRRRYGSDFDVYDERAQDPANSEVETWVSIQ